MIAHKFMVNKGIGISKFPLVSFDNALQNAGVGNYNLVRLSSILPAKCIECDNIDRTEVPEGSLLPIAYATISSNVVGEKIASAVAIGFPEDESNVGVIMEYSERGTEVDISENHAKKVAEQMITLAFAARGWHLKNVKSCGTEAVVETNNTYTTFACVAEW